MAAYDLIVRGGTLVDGTGDRIAAVGSVEGRGAREIDADGALVLPGFVDIHAH